MTNVNSPDNLATLQGALIYDSYYPAPPLSSPNDNVFNELFGIIYKDEAGLLSTRNVSFFEYVRCFGKSSHIFEHLAKNNAHIYLLKNAIPSKTSQAIMRKFTDLL